MEAYYDDPPAQPHPVCQCEVVEHEPDCEVEYEDAYYDTSNEEWDDTIEITFSWSITFLCPDGETHTDTVEETVEVTTEDIYLRDGVIEGAMWGAAIEAAIESMGDIAIKDIEAKCDMMRDLCEVFNP
jgi:hypothetical protein